MKYDQIGQVQWVKLLESTYSAAPNSLAVATDGSFVVAGEFVGTLTIPGQAPLTSQQPMSTSPRAGFLARYDANGTCQWARQVNGAYSTYVGVALAGNGDVCVAGNFGAGQPATFAPGVSLTAQGQWPDGFVATYTGQGTLKWVRQFGSPDYDEAYGVAADAAGNVAVCGYFGYVYFPPGTSTGTWGGITLTTTASNSPPGGNGRSDGFVARYDAQGTVQWVRAIRGPDAELPWAVTLGTRGETYVSGAAYLNAYFDATTQLAGPGFGYYGFVAKYGAGGTLGWVVGTGPAQPGSPASNEHAGLGLAGDGAGHLYVGGGYQPPMQLGSLSLTFAGARPGVSYPYLAALDDAQVLPTRAAQAGGGAALSVFPNPASGSARLGWPAGRRPTQAQVLDALGRTVLTQPVGAGQAEATLPLAALPAGLYLVRLQLADGPALTARLLVR